MAHDLDYFLRRAAEARAISLHKDDIEGGEVAGQLALAYAALARRRLRDEGQNPADQRADAAGDEGLLLRD